MACLSRDGAVIRTPRAVIQLTDSVSRALFIEPMGTRRRGVRMDITTCC